MRKILTLVVMLMVVMSNTACAAGKKGSVVEGKVVDVSGKPLPGVKVIATQAEPLKGYEKIETKTKSDGTFILKGLYPSAGWSPRGIYTISFEGGQCNNVKEEILTAPVGETTMIKKNIVLRFWPFKKGIDGVIVDLRIGLEWAQAPARSTTWDQVKQYAENLTLAGGGFRLPSKSELEELNVTAKSGCGIDDAFLSGGLRAWSSDLCKTVFGENGALLFRFSSDDYVCSGNIDTYKETHRALAVRSRK